MRGRPPPKADSDLCLHHPPTHRSHRKGAVDAVWMLRRGRGHWEGTRKPLWVGVTWPCVWSLALPTDRAGMTPDARPGSRRRWRTPGSVRGKKGRNKTEIKSRQQQRNDPTVGRDAAPHGGRQTPIKPPSGPGAAPGEAAATPGTA